MSRVKDTQIKNGNFNRLGAHLPNGVLLTYPSGHGSLFQFHESFTRQATAFVDSDSPFAPNESKPTIVLLHGFPSSSSQFRDLIPRMADRFHVIAL